MSSFPWNSETKSLRLPEKSGIDQITIKIGPPRRCKEDEENHFQIEDVVSLSSKDSVSDGLRTIRQSDSGYLRSADSKHFSGDNIQTEEQKRIEESKISTIENPNQYRNLQEDSIQIRIPDAKFVVSELFESNESMESSFGSEIRRDPGRNSEECNSLISSDRRYWRALCALKEKKDMNNCIIEFEALILDYPNLGCLYVMIAKALYILGLKSKANEYFSQITGKKPSFQLIYQLTYFNPPPGQDFWFESKKYSITKAQVCGCGRIFDLDKDTQYLCLYCSKYCCDVCNKNKHRNRRECRHLFTYIIKPTHETDLRGLKIGTWKNFNLNLIYACRKLSKNLLFEPENECLACETNSSPVWYQCACCPQVSLCLKCQEKNDYYGVHADSSEHEYSHVMIKIKVPKLK